MSVVHIKDNEFDQKVLKATGPVLVDFWAEWCGPCKQIAPALEELARDMGTALTVAKVNVDENHATPSKYGVRGIPTLILFKNGQVASMKVGNMAKQKLYDWVKGAV